VSAIPTDRRYRNTHEWFLVDGDVVTIGITKFAADELTDITYVALPAIGDRIQANKSFGEVESVKATSDLYSAVDGEITEVNAELVDHPELVNTDSFGKGWMVRVRAADKSPLDALMDAGAYHEMITKG
jgi:glycine cleavage system H protein